MTQKTETIHEVIQMAWCDKTSFEDIKSLQGLTESQIIALMRKHLRPSSFRLWRQRASGRKMKHKKRRQYD